MRFDEKLKVKGEVFISMKKKGKVLFNAHQDNMIVNNGLFTIANLLANIDYPNFVPSKLGFGDSNVPSNNNMTGLQGTNCRIEAATGTDIIFDTVNTTTFDYNQVRFYWNLKYNDSIANRIFGPAPLYTGTTWTAGTAFTVREFAIFTGNDTMFNRIAWNGVDLYMDTDMEIDGYFVITLTQIGV